MPASRKRGIRLPSKPSKLIRVALEDLEKAEAAEGVDVWMPVWHQVTGGVCTVCFAGAVMRRASSDGETLCPADFDEETADKLCALNHLRAGSVSGALAALTHKHVAWHELDRKPAVYGTRPKRFKSDMRRLADDLEQAGL